MRGWCVQVGVGLGVTAPYTQLSCLGPCGILSLKGSVGCGVGAVVVVVAAAGEAATYAVGRLPGAGGALGGDGGDGGGSRIVQSVLDLGTAAESMEGVQEGEGAASVADHAMEEQEEEDVRILASPLVLCFRPHQTWGTSQHVMTRMST